MTVKEAIEKVLDILPEERLRELLDFAEFLTWREEREGWQQFGKSQLARAYGPHEPEYTRGAIKQEATP
jgi:hypothetical protein